MRFVGLAIGHMLFTPVSEEAFRNVLTTAALHNGKTKECHKRREQSLENLRAEVCVICLSQNLAEKAPRPGAITTVNGRGTGLSGFKTNTNNVCEVREFYPRKRTSHGHAIHGFKILRKMEITRARLFEAFAPAHSLPAVASVEKSYHKLYREIT
eukprot:3184370-Rhodomonas_salina.1